MNSWGCPTHARAASVVDYADPKFDRESDSQGFRR